jgi:Protein of unknown function (DUF2924)
MSRGFLADHRAKLGDWKAKEAGNASTGFGSELEQYVCLPALEDGQSMIGKISAAAVAHEIEDLKQATRSDLKERWRALYQTEPPRRIGRDLLVRALAYRIQERAFGGLKPSLRRLLAKVVTNSSGGRKIHVEPSLMLKPGTVLLREWHGSQHQVIVRDDGIVFKGKTYKSLSQVAYRITGAKWSGPRFFGVKGSTHEQSDGTV